MKLQNPQTVDALAAEYVLGTLRGHARRRFERYRERVWSIERRVQAWEDRLMPLAFALPPVEPSAEVWPAIERRINSEAMQIQRLATRRGALRAVAAVVALFAVLAGVVFWRIDIAPDFEVVATISPADAAPIWRIETDREITRLRVVSVGAPPKHANRSFELWALPSGGAPVSLGLLPASGRLERTLDTAQAQALRVAPQVAVSLEPAGGSPSGAPTGPVLFVAERHLPG